MSFKDIAKKAMKNTIKYGEKQVARIESDINRASDYGSRMSDEQLKNRYKNASTVGEKYGYAQELKKRGYK